MDPELIITDKVKNLQLLHGEASSLAMEPQQYSHTEDLVVCTFNLILLRKLPVAGNYHKCKWLRFEDGVSRTKCHSFHL